MGGGLVFFGVGGNTSGGLLDAFKNDSGTASTPAYEKQIKAAEKAIKLNPRDAKAWNSLTKYRFQDASAGGYDQNTQTFTDGGKKDLEKVETTWKRYVALDPKPVDPTTALYMVQAFGPSGLAKPDEAVAAIEFVLAGRKESPGLYLQYAQLAYAAGQSRKGELAGKRAVALAPKDSRPAIQASLDQLKESVGATTTPAVSTTPATTTTPAGTSIVTSKTKNGKIITTTTKDGKTTTSTKPAPTAKKK